MSRLVWKSFINTRADGTSYMVEPRRFLHALRPAEHLLREILSMPRQQPISLQAGFAMWSSWMSERAEEDGGAEEIVRMINAHGGFPRALSQWGYHIEIRPSDFTHSDTSKVRRS